MASNYDPDTVDQLGRAMFHFVPQCTTWDNEDPTFREWYEYQAVAALDCLAELGWRPPLTEQERNALETVLMYANRYANGDQYNWFPGDDDVSQEMRGAQDTLRALLAGARADG